jgi:hypothetical protein
VNPTGPNSICCTGRGIFRRLTKGDKGFTVKQSAMTNKDSLDFKSQIWTSDGRTIILTLSDGRISQVNISSHQDMARLGDGCDRGIGNVENMIESMEHELALLKQSVSQLRRDLDR